MQALDMCNVSYDNEEWEMVSMAYTELIQSDIDYIPYLRSRLAYALNQLGDPFTGFAHAKTSIQDYPEEPDAYASMALTKQFLSQPDQADLWLKLALKASSSPSPSYKNIRLDIDWLKGQRTSIDTSENCRPFRLVACLDSKPPLLCLLTIVFCSITL